MSLVGGGRGNISILILGREKNDTEGSLVFMTSHEIEC